MTIEHYRAIINSPPEQQATAPDWRHKAESAFVGVLRKSTDQGSLSYRDAIIEARKSIEDAARPPLEFFENILDQMMDRGEIRIGRAKLEDRFVVYIDGEAPWQALIDARLADFQSRIANYAIELYREERARP